MKTLILAFLSLLIACFAQAQKTINVKVEVPLPYELFKEHHVTVEDDSTEFILDSDLAPALQAFYEPIAAKRGWLVFGQRFDHVESRVYFIAKDYTILVGISTSGHLIYAYIRIVPPMRRITPQIYSSK